MAMTVAEVRPLYSPEAFSAEQGGRIAIGGTKTGDRLFLGVFDQAPSTPLNEIKGGFSHYGFATDTLVSWSKHWQAPNGITNATWTKCWQK